MQLELNSNTWNEIKIKLNSIKIVLYSNSIEKKWDANWSKRNWKYACDCGVENQKTHTHKFKFKKLFFKKIIIYL